MLQTTIRDVKWLSFFGCESAVEFRLSLFNSSLCVLGEFFPLGRYSTADELRAGYFTERPRTVNRSSISTTSSPRHNSAGKTLHLPPAAMTLTIQVNDAIRVTAQPLTHEAFLPYGSVIANPRPDVHPSAFSSHSASLPSNAVSANQGHAIQYRNVSRVRNLYAQSPSGRADAVMSMFVCSARGLAPLDDTRDKFTVRLLERHPFTTQTFSPVSSTARRYLVIVAPSLAPSEADHHLPVPAGDDLPGRGLPDVRALRAFVATDAQAVTYGAGTWHAPMVALGPPGTTLDFVVSQFMSGVAVEDCQLVHFETSGREAPTLEVAVPRARLEKL
ncbi:hypothetical protein J3458_005487 [Metarhizium acridum]|uniref:uncharacterized protein n=1 Tax=Metarhizium acridum TaxID=92637 RepID=UPI001C6B07CB|nr:hypothetical protein J3458_005487 [Metarhizium acridum]